MTFHSANDYMIHPKKVGVFIPHCKIVIDSLVIVYCFVHKAIVKFGLNSQDILPPISLFLLLKWRAFAPVSSVGMATFLQGILVFLEYQGVI